MFLFYNQHYSSMQVNMSLRIGDRKSTRLNSSHANISYAVFCLKKKNIIYFPTFLYILFRTFLHIYTPMSYLFVFLLPLPYHSDLSVLILTPQNYHLFHFAVYDL